MWYIQYKDENAAIFINFRLCLCDFFFFLCSVSISANNTVRDIEKSFLEELSLDCATSIASTLSKHKI